MQRISSPRAPRHLFLLLTALICGSLCAIPGAGEPRDSSGSTGLGGVRANAGRESVRPAARRGVTRHPRLAGAKARARLAVRAPSTAGRAGMRIALDPETRLPVAPTAEQSLALEGKAPGLDHSTAGLSIVTLPDGSKMMDLQGRFMEYAIARRDSSGRVRLGCVHGEAAAERAVKGDASGGAE